MKTDNSERGQIILNSKAIISKPRQTNETRNNTEASYHSLPSLSSTISRKDFAFQPSAHTPTLPTMMATQVIVDSTDKQGDVCVYVLLCVCVCLCMFICLCLCVFIYVCTCMCVCVRACVGTPKQSSSEPKDSMPLWIDMCTSGRVS